MGGTGPNHHHPVGEFAQPPHRGAASGPGLGVPHDRGSASAVRPTPCAQRPGHTVASALREPGDQDHGGGSVRDLLDGGPRRSHEGERSDPPGRLQSAHRDQPDGLPAATAAGASPPGSACRGPAPPHCGADRPPPWISAPRPLRRHVPLGVWLQPLGHLAIVGSAAAGRCSWWSRGGRRRRRTPRDNCALRRQLMRGVKRQKRWPGTRPWPSRCRRGGSRQQEAPACGVRGRSAV